MGTVEDRLFAVFMICASLGMLAIVALAAFVILAGLGIIHIPPSFFN